ncbi:MAG: Serine/threonine-protein kinase PknD [Planctomycetes bacterium ADurb.Bin126]|nr:MAG: Serine/threonine-protein kinase PknD [Planctomycetes bacterium ADurb.Bin126]HOD83061.1 6-bladed beta-propeller [Phycisphaerae bacterium]
MTRSRLIGTIAAGLLTAWLVGCSPAKEEFHPIWPPPPAAPRIRHVQNVKGGGDLGRPDFFRSIGHLIAGSKGVTLLRPHAVAVLEGKRIFVTDQERQALVVLEYGGRRARLVSRMGDTFLVSPVGVAICGQSVVLTDSSLNKLFVLDLEGQYVRTIDKPGGFGRPTGLAYDLTRDRLYVADTLAHEICVFDFSSGRLTQRIGRPGPAVGEFNFPTHLAVDAQRRLYVTDSMNFRVQVFDPEGKYIYHMGRQGDGSGYLAVPKAVAIDSLGHIYIVDSYFGRISIFDLQGQFLLAIGDIGSENGMFQVPGALVIDSANRIYVCDTFNERIQVLQYVGGPGNVEDLKAASRPAAQRQPATRPAQP